MAVERDAKGHFLPGNKESPGRPKIPKEIKEAIRAACPEAVQALIELLNSKREIIRLQAACELLDRGYGKPETMSKVELSSAEDTKIVFHWINDDANNNNPIQTA